MLNTKAVAIAVLAALTGQAAASNNHRHLHHLDKRAYETVWHTVWETVYVTAGSEPAPTDSADAQDSPAEAPVNEAPPPPAPEGPATTSTTTSVVVVPTPAPVVEAPPPPPPAPTTLTTAIKEDKPPVVEAPPPAEDVQPPPENVQPPPEETVKEPEPIVEIDVSIPPVLNPVEPTVVPEPEPIEDTPPPSNGGGSISFNGKRGLAYNDVGMVNVFGSACKGCGWAYNWASASGDLEAGLDFVPMLWGDLEMHTSHWDSDAEDAIASGVKAFFSFNEPDHAAQANMPAGQAAVSHAKYMNKYAGQVLIGAPSVTNSGNAGEGLEWLQAFVDACDAQDGCDYDFCNVHWYSEAQYANTLFEHIEKAHEICGGKPVWLTEFAPLGSDDQISEFMTNIIPELDAIDYLEAYSYFMVSQGSLMSGPSSLSGYGQIYASV